MKGYNRVFLFICIAVLFIISCATYSRITNLTPAYLYSKPYVSTIKDPYVKFENYKTFSVFPLSIISEENKMNPILERQLLFYVRNILEAKGYKFVQIDKNPDFLITLTADAEYHETYIPPSSITLPYWVPGKTITSFEYSSGSFDFNTFGDYSYYGWGTWSGTKYKTTYIPGYMTAITYNRAGRTIGHFYPAAAVIAYDSKTLKNIWIGSGAGTSDNPDIRVSGQLVLLNILKDFPNCYHSLEKDAIKSGMIGVGIAIFTSDGNAYYPTVVDLIDNMPAKRAGLKMHDMIIDINGVSTLNKALSEVRQLLRGSPGTEVNIKVKRLDKIFDFTIKRVECDNRK